MTTTPARMYQRRRTAAQLSTENPVLAAGELAVGTFTTSLPLMKLGDGVTAWNTLKGIVVNSKEDIAFSVAEMYSTAAVNTASSFPRYTLPDSATTSVFVGGFNFPEWYKAIDVHWGYVNDHSSTGDIRWRTILREVDVAQAVTAGGVISDVTQTTSAPAAGAITVAIASSSVTLAPGFFGSIYGFEIQRIGADALDTLAGPAGLLAVGFSRVDI